MLVVVGKGSCDSQTNQEGLAPRPAPLIDSVDIKYAICRRINCIPLQRKAVWRETRPFRPRAGDVIHPVLWLVKGRAIPPGIWYKTRTGSWTGPD